MYPCGMAPPISLIPSQRKIAKHALQLRALGDETRLSLILNVGAGENEEACICDLTPDTHLAQSTVSHHMKILVDAGLLTRTQRGKWAFFTLTNDARKLLRILS